jgi:hypothetical protein
MKQTSRLLPFGRIVAGALFALSISSTASAQEFSLALSSPPTSMDPQFYLLNPAL